MTRPRLPRLIDPGIPLIGTYHLEHDTGAWIVHQAGAEEIELNGCFSAAELRRFADVLEGKPA